MHTFLFPMVRQWHFSCMVDEFIITYVIFLKDSVYKKIFKMLIFDVSYSKIICGLFEISYDLSCIESAVNLTNLSFWIVWVLVANCHIGAWYLCYGWLCIFFFFVAVPTFCYNIWMFDTEIWLFLPCDAMLVRYMPGPVSVCHKSVFYHNGAKCRWGGLKSATFNK